MTLATLINTLEAATEGSRELDARIWCALEGVEYVEHTHSLRDTVVFFRPSPAHPPLLSEKVANYTTSIDAAVELCERLFPDWHLNQINQYHTDDNPAWGWGARLRNHKDPKAPKCVGDSRVSIALAITIAVLRAHMEPSDA